MGALSGRAMRGIVLRMIRPLLLALLSLSIPLAEDAHASETTILAESRYVMADGDTLAVAEERVLQRAQRKAVEEAGVYLESSFHDYEAVRNGTSTQISSLEIRTLAAAITKTDILESRRSFENDRPVFTIRIRAVVNLDQLQDAIRRWRSEEQLAAHFRQLHGRVEFAIQNADRIAGHIGRRDESEPAARRESGHRFGDGRVIRIVGGTRRLGDAQQAHLAALDEGQNPGEGIERSIHTPAHEFLRHLRHALEGHMQVFESDLGAQQFRGHVQECAFTVGGKDRKSTRLNSSH